MFGGRCPGIRPMCGAGVRRTIAAMANTDEDQVALIQAEAPLRPTQPPARVLDANHLPDHIDRLYRAAWALCGSRHDAEDLVQEMFVNVLQRPRFLRDGNELAYLMRALRNTHTGRYRYAARRPPHPPAVRGGRAVDR